MLRPTLFAAGVVAFFFLRDDAPSAPRVQPVEPGPLPRDDEALQLVVLEDREPLPSEQCSGTGLDRSQKCVDLRFKVLISRVSLPFASSVPTAVGV